MDISRKQMVSLALQADILEQCSELLENRFSSYMLDESCGTADLEMVKKFVLYCVEKNAADIDVPRGKHKKSYRQWRDELEEI